MTYRVFISELEKELKAEFGGECEIKRCTKRMNNGVYKEGFRIEKPGEILSPIVYWKDFYRQFCAGISFAELRRQVRDALAEEIPENIGPELLYYQNAKKMLTFRLVQAAGNQKILRKSVSLPFLDLAILFTLTIANDESASRSIIVSRKMVSHWGVNVGELYVDALKNMQEQYPARIMTLGEAIGLGTDFPDILQLYVLTNKQGQFGAGCILYPDVLEEFSQELGRDLLILPSSIHETLLLPDDGLFDGALENMVREINETVVPSEDVLSNRVYRYRRATGRIEIACQEAGIKKCV